MVKMKRTGNFTTDLCIGVGALVFGLMTCTAAVLNGFSYTYSADLFSTVGFFAAALGTLVAVDLALNHAPAKDYLSSAVLLCGGLFLLFIDEQPRLVLYLLILGLLVVGLKLTFGRPTILDLGNQNLPAGLILISVGLIAALFAATLAVYITVVFAMLVLVGAVVYLIGTVQAEQAVPAV